MAVIFIDGFDKYMTLSGAANVTAYGSSPASAMVGEWSNNGSLGFGPTAPLSSSGFSLTGSQGTNLSRSFNSVGRIIGGCRFSVASLSTNTSSPMGFADSGTGQCVIAVEASGTITLRTGTRTGTVIATSAALIAAGTVYYLEWDITIGAAGAYQIWLNGSSILSGTGNTRTTANNSVNQVFLLVAAGSFPNCTWDDMYMFDSTGTTNNAVLLSNPRVETTFPVSDNTVQFGVGRGILGTSIVRHSVQPGLIANSLNLFPVIPNVACTINSIGFSLANTYPIANFRGDIYTNNAGVPGTLISSGPTIIGAAAFVDQTIPLTTPQSLSAGVTYWIGMMTDTAATIEISDALAAIFRQAVVTFGSGAPGTAPAMSSTGWNFLIWGNIIITSNYNEIRQ